MLGFIYDVHTHSNVALDIKQSVQLPQTFDFKQCHVVDCSKPLPFDNKVITIQLYMIDKGFDFSIEDSNDVSIEDSNDVSIEDSNDVQSD